MRQMGGGLRHVKHNMSLACMFKQRMSDIQQLKMQYDRRSPQSHIAAWRKRSTLAKMPNTFQIFFGGFLDSPNFLQEVVEAAGRVRKVVNGRRCHHRRPLTLGCAPQKSVWCRELHTFLLFHVVHCQFVVIMKLVVLVVLALCALAHGRQLKQTTVPQALQAAQGTRVSTLLAAVQVGRGQGPAKHNATQCQCARASPWCSSSIYMLMHQHHCGCCLLLSFAGCWSHHPE